MSKEKKPKEAKSKYPKVKESFMEPYNTSHYELNEPSAMNGVVRIRRYRTTIEIIDEPIEVLQQRLQNLWDNCDNSHHWGPLAAEAGKLNYMLTGRAGNLIKKL